MNGQSSNIILFEVDPKQIEVNVALTGEKAFNLIAMTAVGINIPPGFVITSTCKHDISDDQLNKMLQKHMDKVLSPFVMVRSSGIGEDGSSHSFAGQLDSFQCENNIDQIITNIRKCWLSLNNDRLHIYTNSHNIKIEKMGVIIQEMIEPEYSGVYFSKAPLRVGHGLIEYVEGHCEKLVSGEVTPESLYITDGKKSDIYFVDKVVDTANKIIDFYKSPQDIEWAYKNQRVYIVQSRPITVEGDPQAWSSTNVNENFPEKLSPLLYSISRRSYSHYFKNLSSELGIKVSPKHEGEFYNIIGLWGHRMYYNMSSIHHLIALTPFRNLIGKSFDNFVGYQKNVDKSFLKFSVYEKMAFAVKISWHAYSLRTKVKRLEKYVSDYITVTNDSDISKSEMQQFHTFLDLRFNKWIDASFADFFAMLSHGALGKLLTYIDEEKATGLQNTLIQSIPNLISNKPIFELWDLKRMVISLDAVDLFKSHNSLEVLEIISAQKEYSCLNEKINKYLRNWGFRCSGELTFLSENYSERPELFIDMFKVYIGADDSNPREKFQLKHFEQKEVLAKTIQDIGRNHQFFKTIFLSLLLKLNVSFTMFSISCRERVRLKQAHMYFKFKTVCLEIAKRLVQENVLFCEKDIFFLEFDDISRLLNGEHTDADYIKDLILLRKKKYDLSTEYPENFTADNYKFKNQYFDQDIITEATDNTYTGLAACGGTIQARAVVLKSILEIQELKKGDILVTKQTDPGWICAFPMISGLVVERGGMLSHGAIVAREFGIPAVVGIKNITEIIQTNQHIRVDGNKGIVECQI